MSTSTYTIPTLADYQAADGPSKVRMQAAANKEMKAALAADDIVLAKAILAASKEWAPAKADKVEIDWTALVAVRVVSLRALADEIEAGNITPAGVPEGVTVDLSEVDFSDVHPDDAQVTRLNTVRVGSTKAAASDLQAAFNEVFEGRESGDFLTCQEITNLAGLPSSGAVAARLFPANGNMTLKGVVAVPATATTPRGAAKI